jgi:diaminohydroxyphosphoribosylaminopyrimidine deaminase/5-amino-6-(5-phosphoribosylamino)uracil reductase
VSGQPADAFFMERALFHARRGLGRTSPNPVVGAIVVSPDGVVVGHGAHERAGEAHAEVEALDEAGDRARGATLYCTLEPCCHVGRTGPCVERIVAAGVARVVAAMVDPNPRVNGQGLAFLRAHGVETCAGIAEAAARRINQPFISLVTRRRPFVIAKAAVSADGRIAACRGAPTPLTSAAANRHAHGARAEVDAIGVGSGTVLADDPLLTARGVYRERPLTRVIWDRRLRTPASARVLSTRDVGPVIILTSEAAASDSKRRAPLEARGASIDVTDGTVAAGLRRLGERGIASLLLEGGAALHAAAWDAQAIDFVRLYLTPHHLGPDGVPLFDGRLDASVALIERTTRPLDADTLVEGYVHGPC